MSIQIINTYSDAIMLACGLDLNQAKTATYWAIATHAMGKLEKMPILVIYGGYGTGKSSLFKVLEQICNSPNILDGKVSKPVLRDGLKENTTALIEEADRIDETLILKRYARQTGKTTVKRGNATQGFTDKQLVFYGSTVLHRRQPFRDPAVDSRSITIKTVYKPGNYSITTINGSELEKIANNIDWTYRIPIIAQMNGRAVDTWMPLFQAAYYCQDYDWISYAVVELNKAISSMKQGQGYESNQLVVSKLISLAVDSSTHKCEPRIQLKAVTKGLKDDGVYLNSWQIGKILGDLEFIKILSGGTEYVLVDIAHLQKVVKQIGLDDDLLKGITP